MSDNFEFNLEAAAAKAAKTTVVQRNPLIPAGIAARLIVTKVLSKSGVKGNFFIFEFVVESAEAIAEGVTAPKEGAPMAHIINMDAKNEMGYQNLKRIASALTTESMDDPKALTKTLKNCTGKLIDVKSFAKVSQKTQKPFTDVNFSYVPQTEAEVKEVRTALNLE